MHHMIQRLYRVVTNPGVDTGGSHRTQDIGDISTVPTQETIIEKLFFLFTIHF